jgi:hypothetical protein
MVELICRLISCGDTPFFDARCRRTVFDGRIAIKAILDRFALRFRLGQNPAPVDRRQVLRLNVRNDAQPVAANNRYAFSLRPTYLCRRVALPAPLTQTGNAEFLAQDFIEYPDQKNRGSF